MIEQFFTEIEGPDRDWLSEDYDECSDEDRQELIIESWTIKDPNLYKTLINH